MFLKAVLLLTPLALGGVWATGGFEGAVQSAPEETAAVAEADADVCNEISAKHVVGSNAAGKTSPTDLGGAISGTLAVADQLNKQDEALRRAGCPTSGGMQGALNAVGPHGVAAQFAADMEKASADMDEAAAEMDEPSEPEDFTKPALDVSAE